MNNSPLVSVIVPNYNHALFLQQRLDSVFKQTYHNFEVIILDDCSTDNSRDIIDQYQSNEKIRCIIYNVSNSGSAFKQWEKGLQYATGEYVWIAESDDWCEISFLEMLVHGMEQDPCCSVAYAQSLCVDEFNRPKWETYHYSPPEHVKGRDFVRHYMLYRNAILNASMAIFRRKCLNHISGVYTKYTYCGDWLFWIELALAGNVYIDNRRLNYFRKHNQDITGRALASGIDIIEETRLIALLLDKGLINSKEYHMLFFRCYGKFRKKRFQFNPGEVAVIIQEFSKRYEKRRQFSQFKLEWRLKTTYRKIRQSIINAFN